MPTRRPNKGISYRTFHWTRVGVLVAAAGVIVTVLIAVGVVPHLSFSASDDPAIATQTPLIPSTIRGRISFRSEPGDYIGQGKNWNITDSDGEFKIYLKHFGTTGVHIMFNGDFNNFWDVIFAAPWGKPLTSGTSYSNAVSSINNAKPVLRITGAGRGCDAYGSFTIDKIIYASSGDNLELFRAAFEQRCVNSQASLFGTVELINTPPSE